MSYHPPWPEERCTALRFHILGGNLSYQGIATALNNEFGTRYSRNAAIGKAARLGLENPYYHDHILSAPKAPRKPQVYKPRPKRQPMFVQHVPYIAVECSEIKPIGLTLLECGDNDCRWPSGETASEYRFCGHPKFSYLRNNDEVKAPYCSAHFRASLRRYG